jgi:hypothetical protein
MQAPVGSRSRGDDGDDELSRQIFSAGLLVPVHDRFNSDVVVCAHAVHSVFEHRFASRRFSFVVCRHLLAARAAKAERAAAACRCSTCSTAFVYSFQHRHRS